MATEPQSTSQAPVNTSLRETSVWSIDTYPKIWEGGRVKKQASEKATQAKAQVMAMPLQTSLEPPKYPRQHRCIGLVLTLPKLYLASLSVIWNCDLGSGSKFKDLEIIHIRAARLIHNLPNSFKDSDILSKVGWMPLEYFYKFRILSIAHNAYYLGLWEITVILW